MIPSWLLMDIHVKEKFKKMLLGGTLAFLRLCENYIHSLLGTAYPWYSLSSVMTSFRI